MMTLKRPAFLIASLMVAASIVTIIARPSGRVFDPPPKLQLDSSIPTRFGSWREEPHVNSVRIIHPGLQETLDTIYSEILERNYVNTSGYRIMLSVAYGPDQRGSLMAHNPVACYEGQGFTMDHSEESQLTTPFGQIPVSRLYMSKGARVEPISYWIMIGEKVSKQSESTLRRLSYAIRGQVPDGLVFRVSSIDLNQARAIQFQDQFIHELVTSIPPNKRKRLSGLGYSTSN